MKFLRFALASVAMLAALAFVSLAPVHAQVPSNTPVSPAQLRTYRAAVTALTPAAAATDFLTLALGTANQVRLRQVHCDGISAGGTQSVLFQLIKRSTLDTSGTSTTPTAIPLNSLQAAAGATAKAYTVSPTLGTTTGTLAAGYLNTNTVGSPTFNNTGLTLDFTNQNAFLNSATSQLVLNAGAPTWNNGTQLACWMEWSEQ